jgi:hypothetical protein
LVAPYYYGRGDVVIQTKSLRERKGSSMYYHTQSIGPDESALRAAFKKCGEIAQGVGAHSDEICHSFR